MCQPNVWLQPGRTAGNGNDDLSAEPEKTRRATLPITQDNVFIPERWLCRKDGTIFPAEITARYFTWRGKPVHVAANRDITEHKRAEESLRKSEEFLANAVEMAHLGHWEYDVAGDIFTFNDYFYRIFHTSAAQVGGYTMSSAEYARRFVHPEV